MTIYILDNNPTKACQMLDDKSLDRMIKDIAQVLCNVHYLRLDEYGISSEGQGIPLKYNGKSNLQPWYYWTHECKANYLFMVSLLDVLLIEFGYRYNRGEFSCDKEVDFYDKYTLILEFANENVPDLPALDGDGDIIKKYCDIKTLKGVTTLLPLVMPKKYIKSTLSTPCGAYSDGTPIYSTHTIVRAYRNYYKAKLASNFDYRGITAFWTRRETPELLKDL